MARTTAARLRITNAFPDEASGEHARRGRSSPLASRPERIELLEAASQAEGRFLWRLVLIIVGWSIAGALAGAGLGVLLAVAGIGPGGTAGVTI